MKALIFILVILSGCVSIGEPTGQRIWVEGYWFNLVDSKAELQEECYKKTDLDCHNVSGFAYKNKYVTEMYCYGNLMTGCTHEHKHILEYNGFKSNDPHFQ